MWWETLKTLSSGQDGKSCTDKPVSASICEISGEKLDQIQEIEDYLAKKEVYKNAYLDAGNGTCWRRNIRWLV